MRPVLKSASDYYRYIGCLSNYHQGSGSSRLHPAVHVVQDTAWLPFDFNVVAEILPVEHRLLRLRSILASHRPGFHQAGTHRPFHGRGLRVSLLFAHSDGRWNLASPEDEDFSFGFRGFGELGSHNVTNEENGEERKEDPNVPSQASVSILMKITK